jgi:ABC-2 type transport system permease protein
MLAIERRMNALGYLVTRSFVNGVLFRLRRLRQPKYLIGAILGGAYFYFYFGKVIGGANSPFGPKMTSGSAFSVEVGAAILFVITLVLSWILPASRAALAFTEAEIAFLFPAPIRRRTLVIMRLLKSQFALLAFSAFMTLLTGRFRLGMEAWLRVGGWWVILNTLNMHRIGASFALQRLRERGMADWKRRIAVVVVLVALAAGVEFIRRSLPPPPGLATAARGGFGQIPSYLQQVLHTGPLPYILSPFKLIVAPNFAHDAATFFRALLPALGIMALHFVWVVRADISFEDASIEAAKKRAAFLAARGRGELRAQDGTGKARTPLFRLRPTGFAPVAFLWKSLLKAGGRRTIFRWTFFFVVLGVMAWLLGQAGKLSPALIAVAVVIGVGCYAALIISFVMIGQHAAAQLRQGIAAMDLLKTYPIPGWQIALGELVGPVSLGTLMQWAALGIGILLLRVSGPGFAGAPEVVFYIVGGMALFLPVFNLSSAILPCAGALLFPGWFRPQESTNPGIEGTGVRLILGIGQLLAIVAAMIPVAFFGAVAWFAAGKFTPLVEWRAFAAGGTAILMLAMEAGLGVAWLGSLYDDFDVSAE